jgi:hypothetical protein
LYNKAGNMRAPFTVHALGAWLNGRAFDVIKKHGLSQVVVTATTRTAVSSRTCARLLARQSQLST